MSGWQECSLGETGRVVTGKTPSKNNPEDWGEDVLFITPTDYKNYGKNAFSIIRKLSWAGVQKQEKRLLPPGSVLVTCIGSDMGKTVINAFPCVSNQQINAIIPNEKKISGDFLYYLTKDLYETLKSLGSDGTAVPILNKSDFEKIGIQLPNIQEQKTIASVLSSLDDKIDFLHRQNKTLEAMAETLFRQWFVEEAQEYWDEYNLSDFADHLKINMSPGKSPSDFFNHYSIPAYDEGIRPSKETGSQILSNKYKVISWTVLVSKLNPKFPRIWPIGELVGDNNICSTEFQVFKPKQKNLYGYIYFLLCSNDVKEEFIMAASGTSGSHQRVRPEDILNIRTNLPSIELAEQYSVLVMPIIKKTMANITQIRTLEKLRDTLLPKLMSGEVGVAT
jgi:type I restriction enzyme S subunit